MLRKEILLLPHHLTGLDQGGNNCDDLVLINPHNRMHKACDVPDESNEQSGKENDEEISPNVPYFMCQGTGDRSFLGSLQEQRRQSTPGSAPGPTCAPDVSEAIADPVARAVASDSARDT